MSLTTVEKTVIGTIIFLMFVLLAELGLQLYISQADIDLRRLFSRSPSTTSPSTNSPDYLYDYNIEVPQPTHDEEIGAKQPRRPWVGWAIIIASTLLLVSTLAIKFFRS